MRLLLPVFLPQSLPIGLRLLKDPRLVEILPPLLAAVKRVYKGVAAQEEIICEGEILYFRKIEPRVIRYKVLKPAFDLIFVAAGLRSVERIRRQNQFFNEWISAV